MGFFEKNFLREPMVPIVGEKFFWGNCLSKTLCKSQPDRPILKKGGHRANKPDLATFVRVS